MKQVCIRISDDDWMKWRIAAFQEAVSFQEWAISKIRSALEAAKQQAELPVRQANQQTGKHNQPQTSETESQIVEKHVTPASLQASMPSSRKGVEVEMQLPSILPDNTVTEAKNKVEALKAKKAKAEELKRLEGAHTEMEKRGYGRK